MAKTQPGFSTHRYKWWGRWAFRSAYESAWKEFLLSRSSPKPQSPQAAGGKTTDEQLWSEHPLPAACVPEANSHWEPSSHDKAHDKEPDDARTQALVRRLKAGDKDAIHSLYRLYAPTLLRRILRLLNGDEALAEDCLQQVFVKAIQAVDGYRGDNTFHAWLNRITTHAVMDIFRKQRSQTSALQKLRTFQMAWSTDGNTALSERIFFEEERREIVQRGLQSLGRQKRMAVILCDWEGYTIEEAAAELETPIGTVASRLYRGRQELRGWLKRTFAQSGLSAEEWLHE